MKPAPKELKANIAYRKKIIRRCQSDPAFLEQCYIRASRDFVWWCDTFAWTFSSKDNVKRPVVPFILFPYQEEAALDLISAVGREDRLIEKARDMGATWLVLAVITWFFIFRRNQRFLVGSRKQEFVDKTGDPKTLFWKIRFLLAKLPGWMLPPISDNSLHLGNDLNGSTIDGESTNENFGAGDRCAAILLDEFALVDCGYKILEAVGDATNCCIYNSTPKGASGAYYDTRQDFAAKNPHRIISFNWWKHPVKARGLYTTEGGVEGGALKIIDKTHKFPSDYKFVRDGKLRSPAYDARESRSPNTQIMAQEWEINYLASGYQYFSPKLLDRLIAEHACEPYHTGELVGDFAVETPKWHEIEKGGRLLLWFEPTMDGKVPESWKDIGIACDVASGSGGEWSSNSSASVIRRSTGEKIAEMTTNLMNPTEFAQYVVGMCKWFNNAYLAWEKTGPCGVQFTSAIKKIGYRNVFYMKQEMRFGNEKTKDPGWNTTNITKPILLAAYAEALTVGTFINHSREALKECGHYVQNGDQIEHARALASEDPTALGASHGDRVIADALAFRLIADMPKEGLKETEKPPPGSYLERRKNWERRQTKNTRGWGRVA